MYCVKYVNSLRFFPGEPVYGTWAIGVIVKFDQPCWSKCLYSKGL